MRALPERASVTLPSTLSPASAAGLTTRAETVMVYYDYRTRTSAPVSPEWREKISQFEGSQF